MCSDPAHLIQPLCQSAKSREPGRRFQKLTSSTLQEHLVGDAWTAAQPSEQVRVVQVLGRIDQPVAHVELVVQQRLRPAPGLLALRLPFGVHDHEVLTQQQTTSSVEEPVTEVDVLPVHEVPAVEPVEGGPQRCADREAGARRPRLARTSRPGCPALRPAVRPVVEVEVGARVPRPARLLDDPRRHQRTRVRTSSIGQLVQGAGVGNGIGIERDDDIGTPLQRGADAGVRGIAETWVVIQEYARPSLLGTEGSHPVAFPDAGETVHDDDRETR